MNAGLRGHGFMKVSVFKVFSEKRFEKQAEAYGSATFTAKLRSGIDFIP